MEICSRRDFARLLAGGVAAARALPVSALRVPPPGISASDDRLLDELSRRCFRYFWEQADPRTGIVRDRAHADGSVFPVDGRDMGSTGATGFGLTALCIAAERGWVARRHARERARRTLNSYLNGPVANEHGWFYHFVDATTGARWKLSEMSTSDSTWLVAGALTARAFFHEDAEIYRLATGIYARTDYPWMTDGNGMLLSHGWRPEGFISYRYDKYCQLAAMYLLGIGSASHALPSDAWYAWDREPFVYDGYRYNGKSLLWTFQYPFCWFDFRGRRETRGSKVDWAENAGTALRAHKAFCLDLRREFSDYEENIWGITSSSSEHGYRAWGGPPRQGKIDGTVVPCAAAGSLMFVPDVCIPVLTTIQQRFGEKIWKRYGFVDAFNPMNGWVSPEVIGIDVGVTLLSAENLRSGNVWRWFMQNAEPQRAMQLAGITAQA